MKHIIFNRFHYNKIIRYEHVTTTPVNNMNTFMELFKIVHDIYNIYGTYNIDRRSRQQLLLTL